MNLDIKLMDENGEKIELGLILETKIPFSKSKFTDDKGNPIDRHKIIPLGKAIIEERGGYTDHEYKEYILKKDLIPEGTEFVVVDIDSGTQEISSMTNKLIKKAIYAKYDNYNKGED